MSFLALLSLHPEEGRLAHRTWKFGNPGENEWATGDAFPIHNALNLKRIFKANMILEKHDLGLSMNWRY